MSIILFILIVLAGFHLWVENVIVPFCEEKIRFRIMNLMVKLKAIKVDPKDKDAKIVIADLNQAMIKTIMTMDRHNILDFLIFTKRNKHRKNEFVARNNLYLEVCNRNSEIKKIHDEYSKQLVGAFAHTMSGWTIYVLPFAGLVLLIKRFFPRSGSGDGEKQLNAIENFKRYKEFEAQQKITPRLSPIFREVACV